MKPCQTSIEGIAGGWYWSCTCGLSSQRHWDEREPCRVDAIRHYSTNYLESRIFTEILTENEILDLRRRCNAIIEELDGT